MAISPALQAYQTTQTNPGQLDPIAMMQADPTSELQNVFMQTPAYQLMYGQNATSLNPVERFRQDPGYEYAMKEGLNQLSRQGSNKGLLDSGSMQRAMLEQSQGMADQNYQRFLGQNNAMFSDYQNRLANLATMGSQNTGSQNAMTLGGAQNANYGTQAGANLATGENISSLFGNQGAFGANAMMNTAATQGSNLMQGAALQTQIDASNAASRAGSMNSLFSGMGSMFGGMGSSVAKR